MNKDDFLRDLLNIYVDGQHMDVDGVDFHDLLSKHGFIVERPITEEECAEEWAQEWDYQPGDNFYAYTDEMKALMK